MTTKTFISYYEILDLDPSASSKAIGRKFRHLASRYHPDNQATGDRSNFDLIVEAHDTLKDPDKRAQYHEAHQDHLPPLSHSIEDEADAAGTFDGATGEPLSESGNFTENIGVDRDVSIQNNLLTMLYFRRRRNIRQPGIGNAELERLSGCPHEHLEFHIWYLKEKGWIATGEDGLLAITVAGVDRAALIYQSENAQKFIVDQS